MKKSKKIILSIVSLGYLIGLSLLIWPEIIEKITKMLEHFNVSTNFQSNDFIFYYGIVLLLLTVFIFLLILLWPAQLPDIPLKQTKEGRLALSNQGISQFIKTKLSSEDLSNIKVTLKNTRRQRKIHIVADSVYQQSTVGQLPRITSELTENLNDLLAGSSHIPIKVDIKVSKKSNSKRKVTRVV